MSEQERERHAPMSDDPDVEAHRVRAGQDEGPEGEGAERRETDEESDVEAHRFKSG
jgi:hypothetical protein